MSNNVKQKTAQDIIDMIELRRHNRYNDVVTEALMKEHSHDWDMETIREAALISTNTMLPHINQQVIQALEKLKGNGRMMSDVAYDFGTAMVVAEHEVVTVSDIDNLIKDYKGE